MPYPTNELAQRLEGIIDAAIDGIITIDSKGLIETINPSAATQFGYTPEEVFGQNISMLMPEPHRTAHDGYIGRYLETKKARIIGIGREVMGRKKDGSLFPFQLAVSEVILNDRVIFTGIIHNLSTVKEAEAQLVELNEALEKKVEQRTNELEQAINRLLETNKKLAERERELHASLAKERELNELKSRFVSLASHEFRTPLSTIMSSASLIGRYTQTEQQAQRSKHINRIKSSVNNLTGILNDFLSLSKIEEGKVQISNTAVSLTDLSNLVIDEVKGLLKEGQYFDLQLPTSDLVIQTDQRILKNILFNITSNAIKYSPAHKSILFSVGQNGNEVIFTIKDQGIGIPMEEQKYLFERFFRASNVETIQGTGLGLSIVKRYIEMLNGAITFSSSADDGTTFQVSLPV